MMRRLAAAALVRLARKREGFPPYAFHDTYGRAYYGWSDYSKLPQARRLEVDSIMQWVDAGRAENIVQEMGTAIRAEATRAAEAKSAEARSKALAAIFKLGEELEVRRGLVPEECVYALCAATCVREDERTPEAIDRAIHIQKIDRFRSAGRAGHPFFHTPISRALLGVLYTTEGAWQQRLLEWISEAARMMAVLKTYTSGGASAR
jgi:hypothetical protein